MKTDWRLTNQDRYLMGKILIRKHYEVYNQNWQHDHCVFCSDKIDSSTEVAYATEDNYHWICPQCYNDFKDLFGWKVLDEE